MDRKTDRGGLSFFFKKTRGRKISARSLNPDAEVGLTISSPMNVQRVQHVSYRAATGLFSGLTSTTPIFFGVSALSQPRTSVPGYDERIPSILILLSREFICRGGLTTEGSFRIPAESSAMQQAKDALNVGRGMFALEAEGLDGSNLLASLIKMWFRTLPDASFLDVVNATDFSTMALEQVTPKETYERVLALLSEPNRSILQWLLDLLAVVAAHEHENSMSVSALSIVFSPTLFNITETTHSGVVSVIADVSKVIGKLIIHAKVTGDIEAKERLFASS